MSNLPQPASKILSYKNSVSQRVFSIWQQIWSGNRGAAAMVQTFAVRIFILGLNSATGILSARFLGPDGRGEVAAMMLWPQLLSYLLTLGLPAAIVYNVKRLPQYREQFFGAALVISAVLGAIATGIGIIGLPIWLSQYSAETIYRAQVMMVLAPLSLLSLVMVAFCEVDNDYSVANQSKYFLPIFTLFGLLILLVLKQLTPITVVLAYMLPGVIITGWLFRQMLPRFQPIVWRWGQLYRSGQTLISYGIRCYGIDLLKTLSNQLLGQALVIGMLSPATMGLYAVAFSISRMLNLFEQAVISVLVSKTSARPTPEIVQLTSCAARITTMMTVLCVLPLMFICPIFLQLLYGKEFLGAVPVFRWLLIEVTLGGTTWVLAQSFMAAGKPGIVTILQGIGVALSIPLLLLLVPRYGLIGVGYALVISTATRLLFVLAAYPKVLKQPIPNLILTSADIRFMRQQFSN